MTGNEAPKIPPYTEYPSCWTHKGIKETFDQVATEPANGAATKYKEAGTKWSQGLETFRQRMLASIASAWEGNAAQASVNAIQRYTTDADQLTGTFTAVSAQVTAAATAATDTKGAIPSLIADPPWYDPDSWPWNKSVLDGHRSDAEDDARDKMTQRYVTPFAQTDSAIPVLPRPINPTQPLDIAGPQPGDTGGDTGGTGGTGSGGTSGTSSGSDGTGNPDEGQPDQPKTEESTTGQPVDSTNPSSTSSTPTATHTTGTQSTGTNPASTQTTPSSTHPGSSTGMPTGTSSPGTPIRSTGSPGRSVSGVPGASASGTSSTAAAAAAASAGRSSSSMPGMMGAGAGRGKQDDDSQHETPDYLINQQNTEELLGEIPKTIAGGVLGAKFRSAQFAEEPGETGRTGTSNS